MLPVEQPFKTYADRSGKPLDGGYVYFGQPDQNPITAPVTVYWDAAGTQPAAQPLRTDNGYIVRNGTPANVFYNGSYSELVQDKHGRQVFYARTSNDFSSATALLNYISSIASSIGSSLVGFIQAGIGAIARTVQDKLRERISVFDFMTAAQVADVQSGGLTLDVTTAIQKAVDAASSVKGIVYLPSGQYKVTASIQVPYGVSIRGDGGTASTLVCYDCDGIQFTTYGYQIGSMFYEDFGLTAQTGTNRTAVVTLANASTMDGLYFNRLRFYGWNECFNFAANWNCSIERCVAQNVNCFAATSGTVVGLRLVNNRAVYASGGAGTATKAAVDVRGGTIQESIHLLNNYFYGFDYCFKANTNSLFVDILNNDLNAAVVGISYNTVNGVFNIKDNYIETSGKGITGAALGAQTPTTQTNVEGNSFAGLTGATIGLQLNTAIGTYQFNTVIEDNVFTGFATYDMQLYSPGRTSVKDNRCMSSAPVNSVFIGQVIAGPVVLRDNWLNKVLYVDNPPDIAAGLLVLDHNTESNTYVPYAGSFTATFTSATGAFGAITYGSNTGTFERVGNVCHFNLAIYTTAAALGTAGGILYISGLPFTPRAGSVGSFPISDVRAWAAGKGPMAGGLSNVGGAAKITLYSRATSNGDSALINATDLANTNPGNILTISGSYLCA